MKLFNNKFGVIIFFLEISLGVWHIAGDCSVKPCDPSKNPALYPASFSVFGAWEGRQYGAGETAFIVARFASSTCSLPEPAEAGPGCIPLLSVGLWQSNGSECEPIPASNSTRKAEIDYGLQYNSDLNLDTVDNLNFWVFPLEVYEGMYTAKLSIVGLIIPPECNIPGRATFNNLDLIPKGNNLLSPNVVIDSMPPTIVNVYTGRTAGSYTYMDVINIIVEFSKEVYFSELPSKYSAAFIKANASYTLPPGLPYLELNSQSIALLEGYEAISESRRKLSFLYIVGTGEFTPEGGQLEVPAGATIQLNAGNIASIETGMEADLTSMPLPGTFGSMSSPTAPKIVIVKTGEKFPPHGYDPNAPPTSVVVNITRRNGQLHVVRRNGAAIVVTVNLQLNAIFNLNEKSQQLSADFTLISNWFDPRLKDPKKPANTTTDTGPLDRGQMWGPRLTFTNRRDLTNPIESVLTVYNTGHVTVIQRYIAAYSVSLNIRDFPFDTQRFQWNIRSSTFTKETLMFATSPATVISNASALLTGVLDPTFTFSNYTQQTYTIKTGIYANYHVLSISFQAKRIATMSSIFLIFPLCMVCLALVMVLTQDAAKDNRLTVPAAGITATMYFSFVVSNMCPPVSYITRLHLLIFQTYIFATVELCFNYYLWRIQAARKELADNNNANKNLLNDAHWMPRKILPPATNVVVQPDGVYKPAEKKPEPEKEPEPAKSEPPPEQEPETAPAAQMKSAPNTGEASASPLAAPVPGPGSFSIKPVSAVLPVNEADAGDKKLPERIPTFPPSSPAALRPMSESFHDDEGEFPIVGITGFSVQHGSSSPPLAAATALPTPVLRKASQSSLHGSTPSPGNSPPSPLSLDIGNIRSTAADLVTILDRPSDGGASANGAGATTVAGVQFGWNKPVAGAEKAAAGAEKKAKSADTGAYPDKTGEFKDVMDLLDSAEVKTFKKLRWGGADVPIFYGILTISNANDVAWKNHVALLNSRFNPTFAALLAISIGCILGLNDLVGLPNPPFPVVGIPD